MDDDSQPKIPLENTLPEPEPYTSENQINPKHLKRRKRNKKFLKALVIILIIIIAALLCWSGWYLYKHHKTTVVSSTTKTTTSLQATTDTYYSTPKSMPNLDLVTNTVPIFGLDQSCYDSSYNLITGCETPAVTTKSITYNQIGITAQNKPIITASIPLQGQGTYYNYFIFIESSPSKYTLYADMYAKMYLNANQDSAFYKEANTTFSNRVTINTTSSLSTLTFPTSVTFNNTTYTLPANGTYTQVGSFVNSINQIIESSDSSTKPLPNSDITKIGKVGNVVFYDITAENLNYYQIHEIYGVIGSYVIQYQQYDTMTSGNGIITLDQSNMTSLTSSQLMSAQTGCGNGYAYVTAKNLDPTTLIQVGSGPSGQTVYELAATSPFLSYIYTSDYQAGQGSTDAAYQNLTIPELQSDGAVLVIKNSLGQYQVYFRNDIFSQGGCGKPVIYLYPTKTESVNVKVGATIYNSVPSYGVNGWTNVLAQPNGQLTYDNTRYPSLYWEGDGNGIYPEITDGTIVKTSDAISTIKQQLAEQGLNNQEISDFVSYWGPKLPNMPYLRLTWFNTEQMNQLAPLYITPRPQTLIRVFLDYQGLDTPYNLPKQSFITPERKGFTVVEWGGLLKNNL